MEQQSAALEVQREEERLIRAEERQERSQVLQDEKAERREIAEREYNLRLEEMKFNRDQAIEIARVSTEATSKMMQNFLDIIAGIVKK